MLKLREKRNVIKALRFLSALVLFTMSMAHMQNRRLLQVPKSFVQTTLSDRYLIFLDGINSFSSGSSPLNGDFEYIENELIKAGISNSNIVYFSYGAAAGHQVGDLYCTGWKDGCTTNSELGDLTYIYLFPIYDQKVTHLPIPYQSEVLDWLIGQIVKKDASAQIDILGFSQGGLIAAYWGSHLGISSPYRTNIHGIIALESPLGGIPLASQCIGSLGLPICPLLRNYYGDNLLKALQIPGTLPNSIVDELPKVSDYYSFTSIQSSTDYTVNGRTIPIVLPVYGHQDALIGQGSQAWVKSKQKLYKKEELGGNGFPTSDLSLEDAKRWITENHHAPLRNTQTLSWIISIINSPPHNDGQVSNESGKPISKSDFWETIQKTFQDWWQQQLEKMGQSFTTWWKDQQDKVADALNQWWQDLQQQLIAWFEQQLANWLNQLCSTVLLPTAVIVVVWISQHHRQE